MNSDQLIGILSVVAVCGLGRLILRVAKIRLVVHWYVALSLLLGAALGIAIVEAWALSGSSVQALKAMGLTTAGLGMLGHLLSWQEVTIPSLRLQKASERWMVRMVLFALLLTLLAGLAPSTKIDELHYHMLTSQRVVQDSGLRLYQAPAEQTLIPQMGYQIGLSVLHVFGHPDAGNILSFAFSVALVMLLFGVVVHETQSAEIAACAAAAASIGVFPSVAYVTSGPHALGDLGIATAYLMIFFPGESRRLDQRERLLLIVAALMVGGLTKISLLPLIAITGISLLLMFPERRVTAIILLVGVGGVLHGPLIAWSYMNTGSPFGSATGQLFQSKAYLPQVYATLEASRIINQTGFLPMLRYAVISLNGLFLVLFVLGMWRCCLRFRPFGLLLAAVGIQAALIAWLLPHEFRFLGGLQYPVMVVGILALPAMRVPIIPIAILLSVPWLSAQAYYVWPFFQVDVGLISRSDFLTRYVAFADDFINLDRLLPESAEILVAGGRPPSVYFPRPVIYTASDAHPRRALYLMTVYRAGRQPEVELKDFICDETTYRNPDAIIETYRTPGLAPAKGLVVVQACHR